MTELTEEQMMECKEVFDMLDKDGSGKIEQSEVMKMMQGLGLNPTEKQVEEQLKERDLDEDGKISFDEFAKCYASSYKSPDMEEEELKQAFKCFDKDGSGFIDRKELKSTLSAMGETMSEDDIGAMMDEADVNKDGKINYTECRRAYGLAEERGTKGDVLWRALQVLGHSPTRDEITDIAREAGLFRIDSEDEFVELYRKWPRPIDDDAKLLRASFRSVDKEGTGKVSVKELRSVLKTYCDEMTESQIDQLLAIVPDDLKGNIDYADLVDKLMK